MIISISDIHRDQSHITFSYYTNTNLQSVCYLMTKAGTKERTIIIGSKRREIGEFGRIDPSKVYILQCFVGSDVSKDTAVFYSQSSQIEIPRERRDQVWSIVIAVLITLFACGSILGLILLFKYPEFFDLFFTPWEFMSSFTSSKREEPEKASLLRRSKSSSLAQPSNGGAMNGWVCDICHSRNNADIAVCAVCHQPRAGNIYGSYGDVSVPIDDRVRTRRTPKSKSHHSGRSFRKEGRHRSRRDREPVSVCEWSDS